ncbi:MAG TPA: L,D-transpeptidase [Xanthobacteraceae bacterium]|nr:L,D-transpeptidase [Xanthobacteraceae bacterium]
MNQKIVFALLAGALGVVGSASALAGPNDGRQRPVYAVQRPAIEPSMQLAYNRRQPPLGGGFIEFLFSDGMSGSPPPYAQPRAYDPMQGQRRVMSPRYGYDDGPAQRGFDPRYEKQMVAYQGREAAGTIVIDTPGKFLYLVTGSGQAMRYGIGVGRPGFTWSGTKTVTAKREWPSWTPPAEMLKRRPDLPRFMEGGPENPLGARALYLGSSLYRIHGSNEPWTIGTNVSSGCIRMRNEDVIDLYGRVRVGTRVVVL